MYLVLLDASDIFFFHFTLFWFMCELNLILVYFGLCVNSNLFYFILVYAWIQPYFTLFWFMCEPDWLIGTVADLDFGQG